MWVVVCEYCFGEWVDFGIGFRLPAEWLPRDASGFDTAKKAYVFHIPFQKFGVIESGKSSR